MVQGIERKGEKKKRKRAGTSGKTKTSAERAEAIVSSRILMATTRTGWIYTAASFRTDDGDEDNTCHGDGDIQGRGDDTCCDNHKNEK